MSKFTRKTVILVKTEVTPGTDIVPAAANAILVRNPSIVPLEMSYAERNIVRGFFGNFDALPTIRKVKISFEVELQSSGAAGTAPGWGPLMTACGTTETLVALTTATYAPNTGTGKTVSIYYNVDGVLHKVVYARGNCIIRIKANDIPVLAFEFIGLDTGATDTALVTPVYTAFVTPKAATKDNTPTFALHGVSSLALESLEINFGNQNEQISRIGSEQILQTDRKTTGSVMFEMTSIATKDWMATVKAATLAALQIIHGTGAGTIMQIDAANVELQSPQFSDIQGIQMLQLALRLNPTNAGNDEFSIVAK